MSSCVFRELHWSQISFKWSLVSCPSLAIEQFAKVKQNTPVAISRRKVVNEMFVKKKGLEWEAIVLFAILMHDVLFLYKTYKLPDFLSQTGVIKGVIGLRSIMWKSYLKDSSVERSVATMLPQKFKWLWTKKLKL